MQPIAGERAETTPHGDFTSAEGVQLAWFLSESLSWQSHDVAYNRGGFLQWRCEPPPPAAELDVDLWTASDGRTEPTGPEVPEQSRASVVAFNEPGGWFDNGHVASSRFWFESEFLRGYDGWAVRGFPPRDHHFAVPLSVALGHAPLMSDDLLGAAGDLGLVESEGRLNLRVFYAVGEGDAGGDIRSDLIGTNLAADYRHLLLEAAYARLVDREDWSRDANYSAVSITRVFGRNTITGRMLGRWDEVGGKQGGQLYILESNYDHQFSGSPARELGVEHGLFYFNAFHVTKGWQPAPGSNFNRLRSSFEVDPLMVSAASIERREMTGVAAGIQLFRLDDNESFAPEVAVHAPSGSSMFALAVRYQRKTGCNSMFEVLGINSWSDDATLERSGLFLSHHSSF